MPQTAQEQHGGESQGHTAAKAKQQQQQQRQPASWWARQQERMREDQKKRMAKPDPWIALKLAGGRYTAPRARVSSCATQPKD